MDRQTKIRLMIRASICRPEQLKATEQALLKKELTGEDSPRPNGISQPRWEAMQKLFKREYND